MRAHLRLHLVFAGMGATAASLPAVLPSAQGAMGSQVLSAAPVLFCGLLVGVGIAGLVGRSVGAPTIVTVGAALQAAALAVAALAAAPAPFILAAGVAGLGFGMTESAGTVVVKAIAAASVTGPITGLTATVAATATVIPLIVLFFAAAGVGSPVLVLLVAALINAVGALAVAGLIRGRARQNSESEPAGGLSGADGSDVRAILRQTDAGEQPAAARSGLRAPLSTAVTTHVLVLAVATALYVGAESVIAGWSSTIPYALLGIDPHMAALGTSAFWALMTIGRLTSLTVIRRGASARQVVGIGTLLAGVALGIVAIAVNVNAAVALVGMALAVVLIAPSYGIILGLGLDRVEPRASQRVASVMVACGAGGGALLPLFVLWVGARPGDTTTFAIAAGACILVSALVFTTGQLTARARSAPTPTPRRQHHG